MCLCEADAEDQLKDYIGRPCRHAFSPSSLGYFVNFPNPRNKARKENKGDLKLLMRLEDHIHWSAVCAVISLATFAVDMRSGTSEGGSDLFGLGTHPFFENP